MTNLLMDDVERVSGAGWRAWFTAGGLAWEAIKTGEVDYAGVAESSGTHYNMMGA